MTRCPPGHGRFPLHESRSARQPAPDQGRPHWTTTPGTTAARQPGLPRPTPEAKQGEPAARWESAWGGRSLAYDDAPSLDDLADGADPGAKKLRRRAVDDHRIALLPPLEATHAVRPVQRKRPVKGRGDQRLLEREVHREARQRHREWHRRRQATPG